MQAEFLLNGHEDIFDKTAEKFKIPLKYKNNFRLLHQTAKLPLKLLLYKQILSFLQEIVLKGKEIFLLADGNPLEQLNKIKQIEWHGLGQNLKLYFTEEFAPKPNFESLEFIISQNNLMLDDIIIIGNSNLDEICAKNIGIKYFSVTKLL
jgi:phosphoglycolate phosphatase-like HAD superfamily hydrolase